MLGSSYRDSARLKVTDGAEVETGQGFGIGIGHSFSAHDRDLPEGERPRVQINQRASYGVPTGARIDDDRLGPTSESP